MNRPVSIVKEWCPPTRAFTTAKAPLGIAPIVSNEQYERDRRAAERNCNRLFDEVLQSH
jgi:hypothetical protein